MSAYILVDIEITDSELYEEVKRLTPPTIAAHGGRYLARGGNSVTLSGTWNPRRLVLLEFESAAQAQAWESSPEYQQIKAIRDRCARVNMVLLEGQPAL